MDTAVEVNTFDNATRDMETTEMLRMFSWGTFLFFFS